MRPMTIDPQPQTASVSPAILALNNAHSIELSWLDAERLDSLVEQSCYARKIGSADAFLLAFDHTAQYDSPNYLWFSQRFPRFVYIDRVAIAPTMRGRGYPSDGMVCWPVSPRRERQKQRSEPH